jgi:hypothetical protein
MDVEKYPRADSIGHDVNVEYRHVGCWRLYDIHELAMEDGARKGIHGNSLNAQLMPDGYAFGRIAEMGLIYAPAWRVYSTSKGEIEHRQVWL